MNIETGKIISSDCLKDLLVSNPKEAKKYKEMKLTPTPTQIKRKKVGRNDPCPCGSGKKFKKCCLDKNN